MNHATNCKFCKKPITIEIDESYAELGDPYKLIQMASCNSCADIRAERRSLEAKIKYTCGMRVASKKKTSETETSKARTLLEKLLKQYANMIARFHFMQGMSWDDECLEAIMEHPENWSEILSRLWKMFRDSNPEHTT